MRYVFTSHEAQIMRYASRSLSPRYLDISFALWGLNQLLGDNNRHLLIESRAL